MQYVICLDLSTYHLYAVLPIDLCGDLFYNTAKDAEEAGGVFSSQESIRSGIPALLKQGLIKTAVQYINFVADSIR